MVFRCKHRLFITFAATAIASAVNGQSDLQPGEHRLSNAGIENLQQFTHTAYIPVGSDLTSFRFRGVKAVEIPTKRIVTADQRYCAPLAFRDPSGSMYCQSIESRGFTRAYEVTYSFDGPPLSSDEHGDKTLTFSVYFRPEELSSPEWVNFVKGRAGRRDAARFFELTTSRAPEERWVVDEDHSASCEGNYVEGSWIPAKPQCEDKVSLKKLTVPSDYVTVRVEPAPPTELALRSAK